jgi:RHS repeat-associated protein
VAACLSNPAALAFDSSGDLFIADDTNNTIREVVGPLATKYSYDAYGDLTSTTDPDGELTSATYDDLGNQLSTTDARGYTTSYSYDADNELTGVTLPSSGTESYTYDGDGNKLTFVDARAKTTTYTYDALDRLASAEDPNSHTTSYTYDPAGNRLSMTDADTDTTSYAYNADNELVTVTQPTSTTLSYTYDPDGNQTSYTNAAGNETTYAYNYLDELTSATDADSHVTSYTYDADGNVMTLTKPDTKVTTSSYDADDELTGVSYSDGTTHSVSYGYDPDGNVTTMTDGTGTSLYAYDPADRLAMYQNGAGATVTYSYDPDGDITDIAYPGGDIVTKAYDDMDRLSSLTDWLGGTTSYSYDADSDPTGTSYPNGVSSATTYDNADQLASITDTKGATTLVSFSYSRDNYGDLSSETDTGTPGAGTTSYTYTSLHQVSAAGSASYGYDAANDLTTSPAGTTQAFDPAGELCWSGSGSAACTSPPSGTTTYTYSADGNRTATTPSSGPSTSYSWDQANNLTGATTGSTSASYAYDGNGLRQSKTVGGTTTHYSWDVDGSLPLLLSDGTNSYIYGLGGTPVEQVSSSGAPTYLLADQLGSTRALTGSAGSLTATFTYDAWGNLAGSTGSATTPFMYAGQYLDSTTGLYYMQARWYDPVTGQFLSVDPLVGQTGEPYGYAGDDPLDASDPAGDFAGECDNTAADANDQVSSTGLLDAQFSILSAAATGGAGGAIRANAANGRASEQLLSKVLRVADEGGELTDVGTQVRIRYAAVDSQGNPILDQAGNQVWRTTTVDNVALVDGKVLFIEVKSSPSAPVSQNQDGLWDALAYRSEANYVGGRAAAARLVTPGMTQTSVYEAPAEYDGVGVLGGTPEPVLMVVSPNAQLDAILPDVVQDLRAAADAPPEFAPEPIEPEPPE